MEPISPSDRPRAFRSPWLRRGILLAGIGLLGIVVLFPSWFLPHDPFAISAAKRLQPPNIRHPLGTDNLGRDLLSRLIVGAGPSLTVSLGVAGLSSGVGLGVGMAAGYFRNLDNLLMRLMDGLMAFPAILLAIAVVAVMGPGVPNLMLAIGLVYIPFIARVTRSVVLSYRSANFVEAAAALGASELRILYRHLMPNVIPILSVQVSYFAARALLTEAALSFLGLGLPPEIPSWGTILGDGRPYLRLAPWVTIFPGLAIALTVLGLNLIGDIMRDRLDPRARFDR